MAHADDARAWFEELWRRQAFESSAIEYFRTLRLEVGTLDEPMGGGYWFGDRGLVMVRGTQDEAAVHELAHAWWERQRTVHRDGLMDVLRELGNQPSPDFPRIAELANVYCHGIRTQSETRARRRATGAACWPRTTITRPSPASAQASWPTRRRCPRGCAPSTKASPKKGRAKPPPGRGRREGAGPGQRARRGDRSQRAAERGDFDPDGAGRNEQGITLAVQPLGRRAGCGFAPGAFAAGALAEDDQVAAAADQIDVEAQFWIRRDRLDVRELNDDRRGRDLLASFGVSMR